MSTSENEEILTTWTSELDDRDLAAVYLCGELDASSAPSFLSDVRGLADGRKNVAVDVHLLTYIDSTGVSALLSIKNALKRVGKRMCLVGCHGVLTKILEITRVDRELPCFDDLDAAIAQMESGGS